MKHHTEDLGNERKGRQCDVRLHRYVCAVNYTKLVNVFVQVCLYLCIYPAINSMGIMLAYLAARVLGNTQERLYDFESFGEKTA